MAQIECGRGHLYDPEVHPTCPYCNTSRQITVAAAGRTTPVGGVAVTAPQRTAPVGGTPVTAPQKTAPVGATPVTAPQHTAPVGGVPVTAAQKTAPVGAIPVTAAQKTAPPRGYNPTPPTYPPQSAPVPQSAPEPTAPPFGAVSVTAAGKTVGMMQSQMGFNPVVGWFVCIEGPSRGKSYSIYGGINSVGRSEKMDITITGDRKISMENHVKVSYSDKRNRFNLIPGDGRNIVYLNDEELFTPMPLQAYDLIDFGETKLLFIPLCGEKFQWKAEDKEDGHGTV